MSGDLDTIVAALDGKKEGSSFRALCPIHNGRSLIVTPKNGTVLFNCKNGCEQGDVLAALRDRGLWSPKRDEQAPATPPAVGETLDDEYEYRALDGTLMAVKGRFRTFGGKTFKWRRPEGQEWMGLRGLKEVDLPLFGAHLLGDHDGPVFMCEGEKAVKACQAVGLTAVCAAGGAGQRNFGTALAALKGRDVVLWPDNDDAGRELMRHLARELDGIAESVRFVSPDVPPKGDGFNYFGSGGTVDALLETLAHVRSEPWVETMPDGYLVSLLDSGGLVRFEFSDIDSRGRSLDAEVFVWQEIPGVTRERFSARLNVSSLSGREAFRRQLDEMFGKGDWTAKLNRACNLMRQAHRERDDSIVLMEALDVEMQYLLRPFILTEGASIIFGQGGSGKTFLALAFAACVSLGIPFLGNPVQQTAVLYVDYESSPSVLKRRMHRLLEAMGMAESLPAVFYWPARGVPLAELVLALQRKIRKENIGFVIIDSAVLAAGADPERSETAARYFGALARLGVPSLSVAHVTKRDDDQYPFGSIFYHNSARLTWNVKLEHSDGNVAHLGLFNRKVSDDQPEKPIGLKVTFDGKDGPIAIQREELSQEWDAERSQADRIRRELRAGQRSVKELAEVLGLTEAAVRKTLNQRMEDVQKLAKAADESYYWGLTAHG